MRCTDWFTRVLSGEAGAVQALQVMRLHAWCATETRRYSGRRARACAHPPARFRSRSALVQDARAHLRRDRLPRVAHAPRARRRRSQVLHTWPSCTRAPRHARARAPSYVGPAPRPRPGGTRASRATCSTAPLARPALLARPAPLARASSATATSSRDRHCSLECRASADPPGPIPPGITGGRCDGSAPGSDPDLPRVHSAEPSTGLPTPPSNPPESVPSPGSQTQLSTHTPQRYSQLDNAAATTMDRGRRASTYYL